MTWRIWMLVAFLLVASACTSSSFQAEADLDAVEWPARVYLPSTAHLPDLPWLPGPWEQGLSCHESAFQGVRGVDRGWGHFPMLWDGTKPTELVDENELDVRSDGFWVQVSQPDDVDAEFDRLVAEFAACEHFNGFGESRDSVGGLITGPKLDVPDLGDAAVQFETVFGMGWWAGHGHVTIVRTGNTVVLATNSHVTHEIFAEARSSLDKFSAEEHESLVPNLLRTHLEAVASATSTGLRVQEEISVGGDESDEHAIVVENDSSNPMRNVMVFRADGSGDILGAVNQIEPGRQSLIRIEEFPEAGYFVAGIPAPAALMELTIDVEPTIGGRIAGEASFDPIQPAGHLSFIYRDGDGAVVRIEVVGGGESIEGVEPTNKATFDYAVPDVPGAESVEIIFS